LGVNERAIYVTGMLEGFPNCALCNLIEGDAADAIAIFFALLFFFLLFAPSPSSSAKMGGHGFALTIRIGCQIDVVHA